MLVVCAGCDGVGKSTISETVCRNLDGKYTHFSAPKNKEAAKQEYFEFINKIEKDKLYICDRFYEGEWTYAPIYRNYTGDYAREIENKIVAVGNYLYVYVTAELDTIIKRTRARGEDFTKEEDFQTILDNYQEFLMDQRLPFTIINNGEGKCSKDGVMQAKHDIAALNLIWDVHRQLGVLPRGNIRPKYFIIDENPYNNANPNNPTLVLSHGKVADNVILKLKTKGIYLDCWFTTPEYLDFEYNLLRPKKIIKLEEIINDKI